MNVCVCVCHTVIFAFISSSSLSSVVFTSLIMGLGMSAKFVLYEEVHCAAWLFTSSGLSFEWKTFTPQRKPTNNHSHYSSSLLAGGRCSRWAFRTSLHLCEEHLSGSWWQYFISYRCKEVMMGNCDWCIHDLTKPFWGRSLLWHVLQPYKNAYFWLQN